ncbi:MAG: hypothetical protein HRU20_07255 [Pseudomonadales bacterium]|nr:hypothetical protein [Pseudomonadales bacterium]
MYTPVKNATNMTYENHHFVSSDEALNTIAATQQATYTTQIEIAVIDMVNQYIDEHLIDSTFAIIPITL